jgi:hypothetical protein
VAGPFAAYAIPPFQDRLTGELPGRQTLKAGPGLDDAINLLAEATAGIGPNIYAVINPLPIKRYQGTHGSIPGGYVGRRLPQSLDLGSFVGQPDFGDGPDIRFQVNPLLLAAQGESTVIPSARGVP